jgi:hypothetical protein
VDREYQTLRDAIRTLVSSPVKRSIADDYDLWQASTNNVRHVRHYSDRRTTNSMGWTVTLTFPFFITTD